MIAIDWAHTKKLVSFDGVKVREESRASLLKRLRIGDDSVLSLKSNPLVNSPTVVEESIETVKSGGSLNSAIILETGCPHSLTYDLVRLGYPVQFIKGQDVKALRDMNGHEKGDVSDTMLIHFLASIKPNLLSAPVTMSDSTMQATDAYRRYYRIQSARVALQNQGTGFKRCFGGISEELETALGTLKAAETSYLKKAESLVPEMPLELRQIKGLGDRLWTGIIVTANPVKFKTLSRYLRFCGLVSKEQIGPNYNRHARMLYHQLAKSVAMMQSEPHYRALYDKCKLDIAERFPDYTKGHVHNAAMNRVSTFLAKEIYRVVSERDRESRN